MVKRKQGIRWKDAVGNKRYRGSEHEKIMSAVSQTGLLVVCALMFMLSSRIMLKDVFSWGQFSWASLAVSVTVMIIVCFAMEISYLTDVKNGLYIRIGVLFAGALFFLMYYMIGNGEEISSGMQKITSVYTWYWNRYYGTSAGTEGAFAEIAPEAALNFIIPMLTLILIWISQMFRKNLIVAVMPALVLVLELLVGYAPGELAIALMFVGILMLNASGWAKSDFNRTQKQKRNRHRLLNYFTWIVVGVGAICLYGITKLTSGDSAKNVVENAEDFRKFQDNLVSGLTDWSLWEIFEETGDSGIITGDWGTNDSYKEKLSNKALDYENKTVLTLEIENKPYGNIYLRGYYADTYENGVWELDYAAFEDFCDKYKYDITDMSENIINMTSHKLMLNKSECSLATLTYVNSSNTRAFMPYFMSSVVTKGLLAEGDGRYTKEKGKSEVSFYIWDCESEYEDYVDILKYYGDSVWETGYEDYVEEHYTQVPEGMSNVNEVALKIEQSVSYSGIDVNKERMAIVDELVAWFKKNTRYTQQPPELPDGTDPVEYFLGESRTGYCMHYASSAVLVLRELGVPARYATGYVVDMYSFKRIDATYVAEILDSRAHAWVEIYLEGIGWVPVEVTNGYDTTNLSHLNSTDEENADEDLTENDTTPSEDDTTQEQTTTDGEETTQPDEEESTSFADGLIVDDTGNSDGEGVAAGTKDTSAALKIILICILAAGGGGVIVYAVMRRKAIFNEHLSRDMKGKRTVRAIKRMNHKIYSKLRMDAKLLKINISDEEYEKLLKKTYPDISEKEWGRFMVVVKAAAFSNIELAEKEMEFCHEIYKKVVDKKSEANDVSEKAE